MDEDPGWTITSAPRLPLPALAWVHVQRWYRFNKYRCVRRRLVQHLDSAWLHSCWISWPEEKARRWKRISLDLLSMLGILTDDRIGFKARLLNEWQLVFFFILYLHSLHFQDEFRGMTKEGLGLRSSASQILWPVGAVSLPEATWWC